jgi:hypothetical protein
MIHKITEKGNAKRLDKLIALTDKIIKMIDEDNAKNKLKKKSRGGK